MVVGGLGSRILRQALGERPGHRHTVSFQTEVPVKPPGMVFLDYEGVVVPLRQRALFRYGLRCMVPFTLSRYADRRSSDIPGLPGRCHDPEWKIGHRVSSPPGQRVHE